MQPADVQSSAAVPIATTVTDGGHRPDRHHSARTEANARLTSLAGMVLIIALAVEGVTILGIHRLLAVHIALGLALLGPLAVKLLSTGWRFMRYYRGDPEYVRAGPPRPLLRVLAPLVVVSTLTVFASGIGLLLVRPGDGSTIFLVHKASFIAWFGVMAVHVLAYILAATRRSLADVAGHGPAPVLATRRPRQVLVGAGLVVGLALGIAGLGWAHPWVTWLAGRGGR